jgi:hypothetical protein
MQLKPPGTSHGAGYGEAAAMRPTLATISALVRGRLEPMVDRLVADVAAVRGDESAIAAALTCGFHRELVGIADALVGGGAAK